MDIGKFSNSIDQLNNEDHFSHLQFRVLFLSVILSKLYKLILPNLHHTLPHPKKTFRKYQAAVNYEEKIRSASSGRTAYSKYRGLHGKGITFFPRQMLPYLTLMECSPIVQVNMHGEDRLHFPSMKMV